MSLMLCADVSKQLPILEMLVTLQSICPHWISSNLGGFKSPVCILIVSVVSAPTHSTLA